MKNALVAVILSALAAAASAAESPASPVVDALTRQVQRRILTDGGFASFVSVRGPNGERMTIPLDANLAAAPLNGAQAGPTLTAGALNGLPVLAALRAERPAAAANRKGAVRKPTAQLRHIEEKSPSNWGR